MAHPLPVGMRDFLPEEAASRQRLSRRVQGALEVFGYALVVPPAFEFADVLERGLGALPASDVLRFIEPESGEVAALRPDMTPQIARILATRLLDRPAPYRLAYEGTVLRRRAGRARRHRQLPQVGVELAGVAGLAGDLELLEVACAALEAAGLDTFTLDLGDAGVVRPLLDELSPEARSEATAALLAKDATALGAIAGAAPLASLVEAGSDRDALEAAISSAAPASREALQRLARLHDAAVQQGLGSRLSLDLAEVRGFAYYTGLIFRVYARGPGESVGGGGRYDELMGRFGAPMPAVGFGLDLDALAVAVAASSRPESTGRRRVLVTGPGAADIARSLRASGVCAAVCEDPAVADAHARAWGYGVLVDGAFLVDLATNAREPFTIERATRGSRTGEPSK